MPKDNLTVGPFQFLARRDDTCSSLNKKEALKWYKRLAAEQGHADAQYILVCNMSGAGLFKQDYQQAVKWWKQAAKQGHSQAQVNLSGYEL